MRKQPVNNEDQAREGGFVESMRCDIDDTYTNPPPKATENIDAHQLRESKNLVVDDENEEQPTSKRIATLRRHSGKLVIRKSNVIND